MHFFIQSPNGHTTKENQESTAAAANLHTTTTHAIHVPRTCWNRNQITRLCQHQSKLLESNLSVMIWSKSVRRVLLRVISRAYVLAIN